jgi:hypothetical protein
VKKPESSKPDPAKGEAIKPDTGKPELKKNQAAAATAPKSPSTTVSGEAMASKPTSSPAAANATGVAKTNAQRSAP